MVTQLQFDNVLRAENFQSQDEIVNFLCDKLAMVPQKVRQDLAADLTVRSGAEFRDLVRFNNHGLIQIFQGVRSDLSRMRTEFLENHHEQITNFYGEYIIDHRIFDRIWARLQSMTCPNLCPWCGVPCCGLLECNDKYVQGEAPCKENARIKHSCQFHRDNTIIGDSVSGSNQLVNSGNCPDLIQQNLTRTSWDQENQKFVELPYTHYETTWRIRSAVYDEDAYNGLFWKWFHAHVSLKCP